MARAAVWSLGRLASHVLGQTGGASRAEESTVTGSGKDDSAFARSWPLLSDPVLRVVVSMLQSCHLQVRAQLDCFVVACRDMLKKGVLCSALHYFSAIFIRF